MDTERSKKDNKIYPWKNNKSVGAALKKGLIPYVDFIPIKGAKKNDYIIVDRNKEIDFQATKRQNTWFDITGIAQQYYDSPHEAIEVLVFSKYWDVKKKDLNTYILCCHIVCDQKLDKNINLSLNKLIDKNLSDYCMFIGVHYERINPSKRDYKKTGIKPIKTNMDRQRIIDRIVERYRRLVLDKPRVFQKWFKENKKLYRV